MRFSTSRTCSRLGGGTRRTQSLHQGLGTDRHVVARDQDQDEGTEHTRHVQADRGERPDQSIRLIGVALDEVLDLVAHLARALAGHVGVDLLEVLDDRRHVLHEAVRLVDERRDQQVDDQPERADAGEQGEQRAHRARDPEALQARARPRRAGSRRSRSRGSPAAASRARGTAGRTGAARPPGAPPGRRPGELTCCPGRSSARPTVRPRKDGRAPLGRPSEHLNFGVRRARSDARGRPHPRPSPRRDPARR